jgi:ubiquinone/menaquinone biosynthesis C-methylase UbiE
MIDSKEFTKLLRCPACAGPLVEGKCQECNEAFEQTLGIWDLRWPRPDHDQPADEHEVIEARILAQVIPAYEQASSSALVGMAMKAIHETLGAGEEMMRSFSAYQNRPMARGNPMMEMFAERVASYYPLPGSSLAVDIGCGVGAASMSLATAFANVTGVDPVLSNLLIAQKYCQENGIDNVRFIQARAQHLPFVDGCADYIVAQNVIEHLMDVKPAFAEVARVLVAGGCFCGDSRNRYDLFFVEPHVRLRFFGFLPRPIQPWMARRLRHLPYIGVRLLSLRELRRNACQAFGDSVKITFPLASAYGASARWNERLARVEKLPLLGPFLLAVFPTHILVARAD